MKVKFYIFSYKLGPNKVNRYINTDVVALFDNRLTFLMLQIKTMAESKLPDWAYPSHLTDDPQVCLF